MIGRPIFALSLARGTLSFIVLSDRGVLLSGCRPFSQASRMVCRFRAIKAYASRVIPDLPRCKSSSYCLCWCPEFFVGVVVANMSECIRICLLIRACRRQGR